MYLYFQQSSYNQIYVYYGEIVNAKCGAQGMCQNRSLIRKKKKKKKIMENIQNGELCISLSIAGAKRKRMV